MKRPKRYLVGMGLISAFGMAGTTTVTIFSVGVLSLAALTFFAIFVTSLPMLFLLQKDITALRNRGVWWGRSRWLYYFLAIPFPASIMTVIYWIGSQRKIHKAEERREEVVSIYEEEMDNLPPLSECSWTQSQIENLSEEQVKKILNQLANFEENEEDVAVKQLPSSSRGEFVTEEDGLRILHLMHLNVDEVLEENPVKITEYFDNRAYDLDVTVHGGVIYTNSPIEKQDIISNIFHNSIQILGRDDLIRVLEDANILPENILEEPSPTIL